jgi:hypothetical protein
MGLGRVTDAAAASGAVLDEHLDARERRETQLHDARRAYLTVVDRMAGRLE